MKNKLFKIIFFSITFLFLFSFNLRVNASVIGSTNVVEVAVLDEDYAQKKNQENEQNQACQNILGDPNNCNKECPAYWIQWCLNLMKYIAVIALFVFVISDFVNALVQNDKDALKKAGEKALKRFIYCVIIFFVPLIVQTILGWFGIYGTCGIGG